MPIIDGKRVHSPECKDLIKQEKDTILEIALAMEKHGMTAEEIKATDLFQQHEKKLVDLSGGECPTKQAQKTR